MEIFGLHVYIGPRVRPVVASKLYLATRGPLNACHVACDGWEDSRQGDYGGMELLIRNR